MKKVLLILLVITMSCGQHQDMKEKDSTAPFYLINGKRFDAQGHRGGRGLWPENSMYGFLKAVDLKVTTLEMDVVVSKDNFVVVSHDPYFNPAICSDKNGNKLDENDLISIYQLPYSEVKQFDCGTQPYPRFPEQEKIKTHKPLVKVVIQMADDRCKTNGQAPVLYNIEIKSRPEWEGEFQPASPDEYVKLVLDTITPLLDYNRFTIQSFDTRILEAIKKYDPKVKVVYLVEEVVLTPEIIDNLSFIPEVFSPDFELLTPELSQIYQQKGIKVIPWTVNEKKDIQRMIDWGVDGVISDYPDRMLKIIENH